MDTRGKVQNTSGTLEHVDQHLQNTWQPLNLEQLEISTMKCSIHVINTKTDIWLWYMKLKHNNYRFYSCPWNWSKSKKALADQYYLCSVPTYCSNICLMCFSYCRIITKMPKALTLFTEYFCSSLGLLMPCQFSPAGSIINAFNAGPETEGRSVMPL